MRRSLLIALLALSGLVAGTARAATPQERNDAAPAETSVYVYTNTDLERFRDPVKLSIRIDTTKRADPSFVRNFIDREYVKIYREFERESARAEAEFRRAPIEPHYVPPYMGNHGSPRSGIRQWRDVDRSPAGRTRMYGAAPPAGRGSRGGRSR